MKETIQSIFKTFGSVIKVRLSKLMLIGSKLLNFEYLKITLQTYLGTLFKKLLDVKPKDKKDYYTVFNWMISKKLAYTMVIIVGLLSAYYILMMSPVKLGAGASTINSYKTYMYDSWGLKNYTGKANIKADSKYIAYVGDVKKGVVEGNGELYTANGSLLYKGAFAGNMYNGEGKLMYPSGTVRYEGQFVNNEFEGEGKLYRENATLLYEGEFSRNLIHGNGKLYDEAASLIFTGNFDKGVINYPTLLNKTTAEIAEQYVGKNKIYNYEDSYAVYMQQIGVISVVSMGEESIADTLPLEKLIILNSAFEKDGKAYITTEDLGEYFEKKVYEGSSNIQFGELVGFLSINSKDKGAFVDRSTISITSSLKEVFTVNAFDLSQEVYIRTYIGNGLAYTFYYADKNSPFVMYAIEVANTEN